MGSWFSTVKPQFAQRMPWITSEVIYEDLVPRRTVQIRQHKVHFADL